MINVTNKSNCCGCGACYNSCPTKAIQMIEDEYGFKYPKISKEKCVNCGLCEKVCPIIRNQKNSNEPKAYACFSKDDEIRLKSSSGGIFSLIAIEILNKEGIVFGAAFGKDFSLSHQYIENINDLDKLRTSKYFQSSTGESYKKAKEFLELGKYVLYTGTPCQIEGLLSFLGKKYDRLYTQDIVCHGVPSPKVWKKYMKFRQEEDKAIPSKINFRDKKQQGWESYSLSFKYNDFEYANNQSTDIFMRAFLSDICLRDSCYNCSFRKKSRFSDITLADFWGISKIMPEMDDDKGTSLIFVNSKKGEELYNLISKHIISKEVTMDNALMSNPAILNSPKYNRNREVFFENLDSIKFDELVNKYTKKPIYTKVISKLKRIIKKVLMIKKY